MKEGEDNQNIFTNKNEKITIIIVDSTINAYYSFLIVAILCIVVLVKNR